jgi:endonuclease/exonuclease/phosphatase family metal-dependent hydrolase
VRLRVASLNVWALPFGLAPDTPERMRRIGDGFAGDPADVWALQEVWTEDAQHELSEAARRAGYAHVWHPDEGRGGSGLFLASRLPLGDVQLEPYRTAGIATHVHRGDYAGGKGFALARLETGAGPLVLVNTHLHAQYTSNRSDLYHAHRVGQVVQLAYALRGVREPVIALGDFNLRERRPEYEILQGLTGFVDAAAALDAREPTASDGDRIDYVFSRGPIPRSFTSFDAPSDHRGVRAELEIAAAPEVQADAIALRRAAVTLERGRYQARGRRGRERLAAGVLTAGAVAAVLGARASRRKVLRVGLRVGAALALPAAGLAAFSSERWVPAERQALAEVASLLDAWH